MKAAKVTSLNNVSNTAFKKKKKKNERIKNSYMCVTPPTVHSLSERSTSTRRSTRRPLRRFFARTASSTPSRTANLDGINCASRCSRQSTPTTFGPSPPASIGLSNGSDPQGDVARFVLLSPNARAIHVRLDDASDAALTILRARSAV